jgi:hypothetical protein
MSARRMIIPLVLLPKGGGNVRRNLRLLLKTGTRSKSISGAFPSCESLVCLLLFLLLFVSLTSSTCLDCIQIHQGSPHALFSSSGHHGGLPDCDKDSCSCCGFQLIAQPIEPQPPLEMIAPAPACSPAVPFSELISDLEHPPRG